MTKKNIKNILLSGECNAANNFSFSAPIYIPSSASIVTIKSFSFIALSDVSDLPPIGVINSTLTQYPLLQFSRAQNNDIIPNIQFPIRSVGGDYVFTLTTTDLSPLDSNCDVYVSIILEFSD